MSSLSGGGGSGGGGGSTSQATCREWSPPSIHPPVIIIDVQGDRQGFMVVVVVVVVVGEKERKTEIGKCDKKTIRVISIYSFLIVYGACKNGSELILGGWFFGRNGSPLLV